VKLFDDLCDIFTNKKKIDELKKEAEEIIKSKNELFQQSFKDEYISMGTWNTYSHHDSDKFKNRVDESENNTNLECKMFDVKGDKINTLKELCGIVEDTIAYAMSSVSPQINANVEIAKRQHKMLALIESIKEQLK